MSIEDIMAKIPAGAFSQRGRFAPKLTFEQRCEVLAFYRKGVSRAVLATAFDVDRRTVTHIYTPHSPHYKPVRQELNRLGAEEFQEKYITEEGARKIAAAQGSREPIDPNASNKLANRCAGVHLVSNDYTEFSHRILIEWRENNLDEGGPGWYYQDRDGPAPEGWLHNGDESRKTSQACLKAVKENLVDV